MSKAKTFDFVDLLTALEQITLFFKSKDSYEIIKYRCYFAKGILTASLLNDNEIKHFLATEPLLMRFNKKTLQYLIQKKYFKS